jgi:protease I
MSRKPRYSPARDLAVRIAYRLHCAVPGGQSRSGLLWRARQAVVRCEDRLADWDFGDRWPTLERQLDGARIAILVADGFQRVELTKPRRALLRAGARTDLVAPTGGEVKGWNHGKWGDSFPVDTPLEEADPARYNGLLLPGGAINADALRRDPRVLRLIRALFELGKPIAAICYGPSPLIDAGLVKGCTLTSYPSIRADFEKAGASWLDREVVVDRHLITSRRPRDIPAFNRAMIDQLAREQAQ